MNRQETKNYFNGRVICVIDDSRAFLAGLVDMLKPLNCTVHTYSDPTTALTEISGTNPDVIITDIEMSEMNGNEVIKQLRTKTELDTVPILVLTDYDNSENLISTMLHGANAFVSKASVREVLVAQLIALIRVRFLYKEVIRLKQFSAIKAMIGTYKHEFGNVLTIIDGKIRKLLREHPELAADDSVVTLKSSHERMLETLKKLSLLREFKEEAYSESTPIIKI